MGLSVERAGAIVLGVVERGTTYNRMESYSS